MTIERPDSCPKEGQIESFDLGWEAHALGMGRDSVKFFAGAGTPGKSGKLANEWALIAWDAREKLRQMETEK